MAAVRLEDLDRELLNAVQWDFPLDPRPYAVLGTRLAMTESDVIERIARVKRLGVLRQLSAIFDTRALGYGSALVAARIDPERVDAAAAVVSAHPGVSHNYKRNHAFNLWYTVAVPPGDALDDHVAVLHDRSGAIVTRQLPTLTLYKIGVKLDMTGRTAADARVEVLEHERPQRRPDMPAPVLSELEMAAISVTQGDLPLVSSPFAAEAERIGCREEELLLTLQTFLDRKLMRRFAAVMNHRNAGFKANAMGVWAVPAERLDELGPRMAGFAMVSHCYRRPMYADWPYSIFTMVHGTNAAECEKTIAAIHAETGVDEYALLWSVKEYKKTRLQYYTHDWDEWRHAHLPSTAVSAAPAPA
jgi:DNA-binding Lrp family transcriptional regulator